MDGSRVVPWRRFRCGRGFLAVGFALVALVGCGGGSGESSTEASEQDDDELGEEYVDAFIESSDLTAAGFGPDDSRCAASAVVDAAGVEALQEAGIEPDDFATIESLEDAGISVTDAEVEALATALETCVPASVVEGVFADQFAAFGDELRTCLTDGSIELMAGAMADVLVHGEDGPDPFAEAAAAGPTLGLGCRWDQVPETAASEITLDDGADAFADAVATELTTTPEGAPKVPGVGPAAITCFVPPLVELLGEDELSASMTTARAFAQYVSGEGPAVLDIEVDHDQAVEMAEAYDDCVDLEAANLEAMREFVRLMETIPAELIDEFIQCIGDRMPYESLFDTAVLTFEQGVAGLQGPDGAALFQEQSAVGTACGQQVSIGG